MSYISSRTYSLTAPELGIDPYPTYKSLRNEAPLCWDEQSQAWLISRYDDVINLLLDHRRFTAKLQSPSPENIGYEQRSKIFEILSKTMYWVEPPNHTRLRELVEKTFIPRISGMKERIQQIVDDLLDKVQAQGHMDIISDLADPLPVLILTELLGVPEKEVTQLKQWGLSMVKVFSNAPTAPEEDRQILQDLVAMTDYFRSLIKQRIQKPSDDLITDLTLVEKQGDNLSQQEIIVNIGLLLAAGIAVATYLIGNSLLALLRHPDQMQKLRKDPSSIGSAIKEFLRYETSLQWVVRRATVDVELHGQLIRKDQLVLVGLGAANRDETRFLDADHLDINRQDNSHLAFGSGPHFCLGASLFHLQAEIAINTTLHRLNGLRLESNSLGWFGAPVLRALQSLPVTFEV